MRCKCCDKMNARFWKGDYYCLECRTAIGKVMPKAHGFDPTEQDEEDSFLIDPDFDNEWEKYD